MRLTPTLSGFCAVAMLSGCLAAPVVGPSKQAQDDAIFACAKEVGDQIFPLTSRVSTSLGNGGQSVTVQVVASERLTAQQAASINACAADRLAAVAVDPAPVTEPTPDVAPVRTAPAPRVASSGCAAGAPTLYGGAGYCIRS